ncbi:hypothetical protein DM02DRAFT_138730 [Periconia macrospinosa]|uniref:Uncharacterized protein n=1 Tax=Periconia macrospinosa TaxID=97972 RepID=A0A2V1DCM8_9PLEO|nr:hypothetical protein DM02DRAFT_138730 [Periconia macrospinosa]
MIKYGLGGVCLLYIGHSAVFFFSVGVFSIASIFYFLFSLSSLLLLLHSLVGGFWLV